MRRDTIPPRKGWRAALGPWGGKASGPNGSNGAARPAGGFLASGSVSSCSVTNPLREISSAVAATIYGWGGASRVGSTTALPMGCRLRASLPRHHFPSMGR